MKKFLIAHNNIQMREVLHEALWQAFTDNGERPLIVETSNKEEALLPCAAVAFDFVVVSLNLAAHLKKPIAQEYGLKLLPVIRERGLEMPVLIIAPTLQPEVEQQAVAHRGLVIYEDDIRCNLDEEVVRRAQCHAAPQLEIIRNRLDIVINLARHSFWIKDQLGKMNVAEEGDLEFCREPLDKLTLQLKDKVKRREPDWDTCLRQLGAELKKELFVDQTNLEFRDAYQSAKRIANCREDDVRIRFAFGEREEYFFPMEAILTLECDEYWMLQAPLFRSVAKYPKARPLFDDHKEKRYPINCLIINADTFGTVDKLQRDFPRMTRTKEECDRLRKQLEKCREQLNVGKVRVLSADDVEQDNSPSWDNLQRVLESELLHLVHYAGHSYYNEQEKRGFVFLPESFSQTPQPVGAREFASAFRETPRFVYLSSCESSADDFVFELANIGIPAVAGFRWGVREDSAFEYSKSFYRHLFKEQCLEESFWKARKEIHDNCPTEQNMIWAAAMLVIQTDQ